ncbi:MAG: hypothetical protein HY815_26320 [Candidatus Riflebacteria bacterium]|nr:hypothetical protein [Candidatus Riflebacteria bacterium]
MTKKDQAARLKLARAKAKAARKRKQLSARAAERLSKHEKRVKAYTEYYARLGVPVSRETLESMASIEPIDARCYVTLDPDEEEYS